jgi:hypothetical protein
MKKIIIAITATVVISTLSVPISARTVSGKIDGLITWLDGHTVIRIQNGPQNGCLGGNWYSLGVKGQDVKAEPMLSVALAAYLANRTVTIVSQDGVCQGGEEKLTNIQITP